jgi:hypothetical protein
MVPVTTLIVTTPSPVPRLRSWLVIRGELEERKHSPLHWGSYAKCMPLQEEEVRTKTMNMSRGERKIDSVMQGYCSRMWQIAESNVGFFRG